LTILAVDPGTKTGWALRLPDGSELSGTWDFSPRRGDGAGVRYLRLRVRLDEIHRLYSIDHLVYELPAGHFKSGAAADVIGGMVGNLQAWAEAAGVPYEAYAPGEIKRHATGKGNAPKDAILAAARNKWGDSIADDNQADACWLLDLAVGAEM
jgi:Holliday junction resolvasome RuvABC endonuclease subunit